jgi:origin recognition complex subunit 3
MELEHQRCYLYQPDEDEERPSKRQCIGKASFQPHLKERLQSYRDLWAEQEQRIQVIAS